MRHHTSNRLIALVLLALLTTAPALAFSGITGVVVPGHGDGGGVRFELVFRSGDRINTAVVAFETSPVEMLSPALTRTDGCSRSQGLVERLHRAVVLVRALGRAAWAIVKQHLVRSDADADGTEEEQETDADRRRSA